MLLTIILDIVAELAQLAASVSPVLGDFIDIVSC